MSSHPMIVNVDKAAGILRTPGIDFGRPLKIVHEHHGWYVVKRAGCRQWCSQGQDEYTPMELMLIAVSNDLGRVVREERPGHKWKDTLKVFINLCNEHRCCARDLDHDGNCDRHR